MHLKQNMKNKITTRLFLYFSLSLIIFSLFVGGSFTLLYTNNILNTYKNDLKKRTEVLANRLSIHFEDDLFKENTSKEIIDANFGLGLFLGFIDDIALSNVWIVDKETETIHVEFGKYRISSSAIPTNVRELINLAMEGQTAICDNNNSSFLEKNLVIASPITLDDGSISAVLVLHARSHNLYNNVLKVFVLLTVSLFISLLLALIPSYFSSVKIVRPLKMMNATTNELTQGKYTSKTGVDQPDEVGRLAKNIDILANKLLLASKESQELEVLRKNYISNISHELRTPISVIRSSLEALIDRVVTNEDLVDSYHNEMFSEVLNLENMVNDLLELSRLKSPNYKIEKSDLDFISIVEDVVKTSKHLAKVENQTIVAKTDLKSYELFGDYGRLRQMLLTVVGNAIKFADRDEPIYIHTFLDDDRCIVEIINKGPGIKEKDLPYIFQEYYTVTEQNNKTGTGLGLAIAKIIADRHDITINVNSVPGQDTVFTFVLE